MLNRAVMGVVMGLPALAGCGASTAHEVLSEASGSEFGSSGYLCADTVAIADTHGVDYEQVVNGCLARDRKSMHTFFWLSKHAGFDAASSQGHATVSGILLRELGDDFLGRRLSEERLSVQKAVRDDLLYDLGYRDTPVTLKEIKQTYPKTLPAEWIPGW